MLFFPVVLYIGGFLCLDGRKGGQQDDGQKMYLHRSRSVPMKIHVKIIIFYENEAHM